MAAENVNSTHLRNCPWWCMLGISVKVGAIAAARTPVASGSRARLWAGGVAGGQAGEVEAKSITASPPRPHKQFRSVK